MSRLLGPKDLGSFSIAAIASLAAIGLGTFYVMNSAKQSQLSINEAVSHRAAELGQNNNLSNLSVIRSLLTDSRTPDQKSIEQAVYPKDYFSKTWDLVKNPNYDLKNVTPNESRITVQTMTSNDASMDNAVKAFKNNNSQATKFTDTQTLEIVGLNRDKNNPYYIASVDVKANRLVSMGEKKTTEKNVVTYGRINLAAPLPKELTIKIKPAGSKDYTDNFGTIAHPLPSGNYQLQLSTKGIVHHADIDANGRHMLIGVGPNGNLTHGANNIFASSILGETEPFLLGSGRNASAPGESEHFKKQGCEIDISNDFTPGTKDATAEIVARVYGVDGVEASRLTIIKTVIVGSAGAAAALSSNNSAPGEIACQNSCPKSTEHIYDSDSTFASSLDRSLNDKLGNDIFEAGKTGDIVAKNAHGIICSNYSLTGQDMKTRGGMNPSDLLKKNPGLYYQLKGESMVLKEYVAFIAPSCQREEIGKRDSCGCFAADTSILMADGRAKLASEIRVGDMLWNPKAGKAQAVKKVIAGPEQLALIEIKSAGHKVTVTSQHPFLTKTGLKPAFKLTKADVLLDGDTENAIDSIVTLDRADGESAPEVWNFELVGSSDDDDHYVLANGVMTGDLYLQIKLNGKSPDRKDVE